MNVIKFVITSLVIFEVFITLIKFTLQILTSRLSGTVHRHLHALGVDGDERRGAADEDAQIEALAATAPTNKPEIIELGHVVLHDGRVVPKLPTEVLVVASPEADHGPVADLAEGDHLEGGWQSLVAPPVRGKRGAENVGSSSLDELSRVLGQDLTDLPLCPPPLRGVHGGALVI